MKRLVFVTVLLAFAAPGAIAQTTFTVNSTDDVDDGTCNATHCSLREAIDAANAGGGVDTIAFDIPGSSGTKVIQPAGALPAITDPAVIDATTQPGFTESPVIELRGGAAGPSADGLRITAGGSTVRGLAIHSFQNGIVLETLGGNVVEGNAIGTTGKLLLCKGNSAAGIRVTSSTNTIGGTTLAKANRIVCSGEDGIYISNSSDNDVLGNLIGVTSVEDIDSIGAQDFGNLRDGIRLVDASGTEIGRAAFPAGNLIARNDGAGVSIGGASSTGNLVDGNTITENGGDGVVLPDAGSGNLIKGNSIFNNGGLGIDLGADGVTANDPGDFDSGPNDLQNYPVVTSAIAGASTLIDGTLSSTPSTDFDLEFFTNQSCSASSHGEGADFLLRTSVTTNASGEASFTVNAGGTDPGEQITVTATNAGGSTSEFSACVPATSFAVVIAPDSFTTNRGGSGRYQIDVVPVGGAFAADVRLKCVQRPAFTSCTFEPDTVVPGVNGERSILTLATNVSGTASLAPAGQADVPAAPFWQGGLAVGLLALALLGVIVVRRDTRRRRFALPLIAALLLSGAALQAGCNDDNPSGPPGGGTPPGRYEVVIEAKSETVTVLSTAVLIVTP